MAASSSPSSPPLPAIFSSIGDMQKLTRQKNNFDKVEASLPNPTSPALRLASDSVASGVELVDGFLSKIGAVNPFGRDVVAGDEVWLFDNTAFQRENSREWTAEFVTAVFKKDAKCKIADMVSGIADVVGLANDAKEKETIEKRVLPLLWDVRIAKTVNTGTSDGGVKMKLGPTNVNGIATNISTVRQGSDGKTVLRQAKVGKGVSGILQMTTFYAQPEGWGIISDIDDTIKVTMTADPVGILKETFVNTLRPIPGMPELYKEIAALLTGEEAWFYLSASPYNLYPMLKDFRSQFYPQGTMILRDSSWKTIAGLLTNLTVNTLAYKVDRMKKIYSWLPKRKMLCFGDSTQSDPEAYGEIYRAHPGWVKKIFIRKATEISEIGIEAKNDPKRFEQAFEGVPREIWHVFENPEEIAPIIRETLG